MQGAQLIMVQALSVQEKLEKAYGRELNIFVSISLKHEFVFVQNPKVGSTSLKYCINRLALTGTDFPIEKLPRHPLITETPLIKPYQLPASFLDEIFTSERYTRFAFVRNPYTRLLSCYLDKIVGRTREAWPVYKKMGLDKEQSISFDMFISFLHERRKHQGNWNPHWRPQHNLLKPHIINYTFVGKFENFEDDLVALNSLLGNILPPLVTRAPHQTRASEKEENFYTPDLRRKVEEIYIKDFESFAY